MSYTIASELYDEAMANPDDLLGRICNFPVHLNYSITSDNKVQKADDYFSRIQLNCSQSSKVAFVNEDPIHGAKKVTVEKTVVSGFRPAGIYGEIYCIIDQHRTSDSCNDGKYILAPSEKSVNFSGYSHRLFQSYSRKQRVNELEMTIKQLKEASEVKVSCTIVKSHNFVVICKKKFNETLNKDSEFFTMFRELGTLRNRI